MTIVRPPAAGDRERRALSLYLLPSPLMLESVLSLWFGNLQGVLTSSGSYALFVAAALLIRRGSLQEAAVRRRPLMAGRCWPWKTLGVVVAGIATAVTAFTEAGYDLAIAIVFGLAAAAGARLVYGGDPSLRPAVSGGDIDDDELRRALVAAYDRLDRIEQLAAGLPSIEFRQRLRSIARQVAELLGIIEREPANFVLSRRFLNVYLEHSLDVMEKYSRVFPRSGDAVLEHSFRSLLVDIENTCDQQHHSLLKRDIMDLDVQIEVLSRRLREDGFC